MISDFFCALGFLTIFPSPQSKGGVKEGDLARSMFFFPLIGILIGVLSLLVVELFSFSPFGRIKALALVTLPILFSGGLHVDGFSDFCDGFFSGKNKEEILRIMRDSRIGVWGASGVVLLLFWKWELLATFPNRATPFLLSLTASRWAQVALAYFLPYANPVGGLGQTVAKKVGIRELAGATGFLSVLIFSTGGVGVICFLALLPFLAGVGFLFWKRVQGITGDLLGAASEATEVFVFLIFFLIKSGNYQ